MADGSTQLPEMLEYCVFDVPPPATYPDQLALLADCPSTVAADAEGTATHAIEPTTASAEIRRGVFMFVIR